MSYLVLARKYRPQNFDELVGQKAVVHTLKRAIELERIHHAFLFTGSRGVGKTTMARLLAKCLSCETGVTATPCGDCATCKGITEGTWVDVLEIDGASHTGVDDVRGLRESARYQPSISRYKIFIIDEVHMLSTNAFNALLKTLEEPPPHVKFIFATTEPHKIPITVLSRCQRYDFGRISMQQILARLTSVLKQEGLSIEEGGLRLIAAAADGGMRDALSLLDQVLSFVGTQASEEQVATALGLADRSQVVSLVDAIIGRDAKAAIKVIEDVYLRGINLSQVMEGVTTELRHLAVAKSTGSLEGVSDLANDVRTGIEQRAEPYPLADLQRLFSMALMSIDQIGRSTEKKLSTELNILRMVERPPLAEMVAISQALAHLETLAKGKKPNFDILSAPSQPSASAPQNAANPMPVTEPVPVTTAHTTSRPQPSTTHAPSPSQLVPQDVELTPPPAEVSHQAPEELNAEEPVDEFDEVDGDTLTLESMPLENVDERWLQFISEIAQKERKLASHLEHAFFTAESSFTEGAMQLVFKKKLHHSALESGRSTDYFKKVFQNIFSPSLQLQARYEPSFQEIGPSVQMAKKQALQKAHAALRLHAEENPVVQNALALFGGAIKSVERLS